MKTKEKLNQENGIEFTFNVNIANSYRMKKCYYDYVYYHNDKRIRVYRRHIFLFDIKDLEILIERWNYVAKISGPKNSKKSYYKIVGSMN